MKDKLWFFGSFQYPEGLPSRSPGTDPEFPAQSNAKRYFCKLNYQINQNNRLQFQTHDDFYRIPERATADHGAEHDRRRDTATTRRRACCGPSVINPTTVFEARYSGFYGTDHGDPLERRSAHRHAGSRTSTPATSPAASTTGTTASAEDRVLPARSPSTPTTSWARSTTSRWACSTTAAAASTPYGYNDYIYTYGSDAGVRLHASCRTRRAAA